MSGPTRPASGPPPAGPIRAPAIGERGLPILYGLARDAPDRDPDDPAYQRSRKTSEVVAGELVRNIVARGLRIGNRLPDEASMLLQYGVGRESLREALRILEIQGLITIKRGPGGGPVVIGVDPASLARTAALYFHLSGATYDEVFQTWQVLEPAVAANAAAQPDGSPGRIALASYCEALPVGVDRREFMAASNGFHSALAQASGGRVLVLLLRAVSHIVVDHVVAGLDPLEERHSIEQDHADIAAAIAEGDPPRAAELMSAHIGHVRDSYLARSGARMQELVEWR